MFERPDPEMISAVGAILRRLHEQTSQAMAPALEISQAAMNISRGMAPLVESAERVGQQMDQLKENMQRTLGSLDSTRNTAAAGIEVPKPRESYIVEAQYETIEAIQKVAGLLQVSLDVQGKQMQILNSLLWSTNQQTRLTRWVLGFAVAGVIVTLVTVAITLIT